jgi:hypothetical protein
VLPAVFFFLGILTAPAAAAAAAAALLAVPRGAAAPRPPAPVSTYERSCQQQVWLDRM